MHRSLLLAPVAALMVSGGLLAVGAAPAGASGSATIPVSTAAELNSALAAAKPGDTIQLADGGYTGKFVAKTPGTASQPITITGSAKAVLHSSEYPAPVAALPTSTGASPTSAAACPVPGIGYGLWLNGAPHWNLKGFTVDTASKGIVMDASPNVTIDQVEVRNIGDEGVHFRKGSADGVIRNSYVHDTGQNQPGYGEGVYIGSAKSNWACYGGSTGVDASDNVQVLDNRIGPNVAAEGLDIKEGTRDGVVSGNTFDGAGSQNENSADSAIDAKGDGYRVDGNTVTDPYLDGIQTHTAQRPYGCGNTFADNTIAVGDAEGYGINVTNNSSSRCGSDPNIVYSSNRSTGGQGLTNIAVTSGG